MPARQLRAAATAAFALAASIPGLAAEVTLSHWAYGSSGSVSGSMYSGQAGGFGGSLTGAGSFNSIDFITYCVELTESFGFSPTAMTQYDVVAGNTYFGSTKADRLGRLLTYARSSPTFVDTAAESTSMQLAVWNIVYDNDFTVSTGTFTDQSVYAAYANTLLAGAAGVTTRLYDVSALKRVGTQDFLLSAQVPATPASAGASTPEPSALALSALALFGLGSVSAMRRRRAVANRAG